MTPYLAPAWAYGSVPAAVWDLARAPAASSTSVAILTTDALAPHERQPVGAFTLDGVRVVRARNVSGLIRTWLDMSTPLGLARRAREVFAAIPPDIQSVSLQDEQVTVVPANPDVATVARDLRRVYALVRSRAHDARSSAGSAKTGY